MKFDDGAHESPSPDVMLFGGTGAPRDQRAHGKGPE